MQLNEAEQRERRRLAQVLHDHLQQLLVAAKMCLNMGDEQEGSPALQSTMDKARGILDQAIQASRSLSMELDPPVLMKDDLVAAMKWLAEQMWQTHEFLVEVHSGGKVELENEQARTLLFQSVRELLFNCRKHSQVDRAEISIGIQDQDVVVTVADGGVGFDPAAIEDTEDAATSFGLFSVRERLELIGGRLDIDSALGKGCRMSVRIPGAVCSSTESSN